MQEENTNTETSTADAAAATAVDQNADLQSAVDLGSDLLVMARDQKNTGIAILMATEDERTDLRSFIARGKQQVAASKQISALALAKAKERNAGRKLPPSKQPKANPAARK